MGGSSTPTRTESPKASGLSISTATSGKAIALAWGMPRLPINVISYHDFEAIEQVDSQNAGGKGGGGSMETVSYLYKVGLMLGLCAGPIASVPRVFVGKAIGTPGAYNFAVVPGSWDQPIPNELLASPTLGDDGKLNYRGVAGLAAYKFDLGDSDSLPNITAEVDTGTGYSSTIRDASPGRILADYLTIAGIPASYLTELDNWSNWCVASGLFFSPAYTEREAAREAVKRLMQLTGSDIFISDGKLRVVIYADEAIAGNGMAWAPDLTPQYDLTYDDFLDSDMPVRGTRTSQSDSKNQVRLKFSNRAKDYNEDYATARDLSSIQKHGLREEEIDATQEICDANVAALSAELIKQRKCYIRGSYEFKLGWKFDRLEPGDLVTITDDSLHLDRFLVRITEIEDDEDGVRTVQAEEVLVGASAPSRAPVQETNGFAVDYNTVPGSLNAPAIFEPPLALSGAPQVWIAASGGENWGGCDVWVSDDGDSYKRLGRILGRARHGTLTAQLPVGGAIDSANTLAVDMTGSRGSLISGTEQNALDLLTLCWVDGELLAYRDATLTGPNQYGLSWLVRGAYGTQINAHAAGKQFARLDDGVAKFDYDAAKVGKQIHIKLQSFNIYGSGFVDLAEVDPISYTLVGAPLADVTGLAMEQPFTGSACKIKWNAVDAAAGYTVEVWAGSPQSLRRTAQVGDARRFEYTWDDAKADGGPWRSLTFRVKAVSATGVSSNWVTLSASNPAPAAPTGVRARVGFGSITLDWDAPTDTDVMGYVVHLSETSGFTPVSGNRVSDDTALSAVLFRNALGAVFEVGKTYYLKVAAYDLFGKDTLNYAGQIAITMTAIPAALLELQNLGPANFDTATAEAIANMQALSNADLYALAQIDTELLASMSSELQAARDAVQQQALTLLNALAAQDTEASKRRAASAAIVRETQTRITELQAVAEDILALVSRMGTAEAGIVSANQAIVDGDSALAQQITSLASTVGSNKASADSSIQTLTNADAALGARIDSLTSTVNADRTSGAAAITAEQQARATADTALSGQITSLSATVTANKTAADQAAATNSAEITAEQQARASGDAALAQQITSLSSTVGGNTTSISTLTQSVDGILGQWSVSIVQNAQGVKKVSGVRLLSDGTSSAFDILADVFRVSLPDGSGSKQVFTVGAIAGIAAVGISGNLVIDGTLHGRSIVAESVTVDKIDTRNLTIKDANGNVIFGAGTNVDLSRINGLGALASKSTVGAADMSVASLSAITATLGTFKSADSGQRTEISDSLVQVFDSNGVLRVRLGVWQ